MKLLSLLITGALWASVLPLHAAEDNGRHARQYRAAETADEIIGIEVRNLQNERLGKVKFVTADLQNARLVEVVVTSGGGFFGLGARLTAVPPRALTTDANGKTLRLNASRALFDSAPRFDASHMAPATQRERVAAVNRHFGLKPWFFLDGQAVVKNAEILPLGYVEKLDRILDLPIYNRTGGYVAKIGTLLMDLPKGQIVHVVANTNSMAGASNVILQPRAMTWNTARSGVIMDETSAQLAGEPNFRWLDGTNNTFQEEKYVNREVKADKGLHSKQNAHEGVVSQSTTMEQGKNFRDVQKTNRIKQAIYADSTLSANARNVEVVTLNAQTTLRGHVNSIAGKARIGKIAMEAGRPENVSNLLEVRPTF